RKDLYGADFKFDSEHKQTTLLNFSEAYRNAKEGNAKQKESSQHLIVDLNVSPAKLSIPTHTDNSSINPQQETEPKVTESTDSHSKVNRTLWENSLNKWESEDWVVKDSLSIDNVLYISNRKDNPGTIQLGFHEGHYYI